MSEGEYFYVSEHDMQLFIRAVKQTAKTAYSKTLATSSGETLDSFVMLWFRLERLSHESDEQLRKRCEAMMRREFKP